MHEDKFYRFTGCFQVFRVVIDGVVEKRVRPRSSPFIPSPFVRRYVCAVTVGVAHETAVLMIDDIPVMERQEILEKIITILLA